MKDTPDRSNPPGPEQTDSAKQHQAEATAERLPSDNHPGAAQNKKNDKPPEVSSMRLFWNFVTQPEHANAIMAIFTVLIFLATTAYSIIALLQWKSMQGQLDLARQQSIALQQAVVRMWVSDFVLESPHLTPALPISFRNEGIAIATNVSFHGAFTWKSEPGHVTVGQPTPINIEIPSMPQGDKGAKGYMLTIPELSQDVLREIRSSTKARTIQLSGKFTYSNGFDQIISEDICKIYFAHEQLGNSSDAGFIDCDQYAAKVKFWENREQEYGTQH